jgi:CheY-like chemotaxis protein
MPHKLLLADDSVTIQRVIELTFADEDIHVHAVGDGQTAIASIQADRPDIVLADVGMPERNGYEVAAFVKGNPELAHIPVLLLTGAFEPIDEARARAVGCDGVLVKPFEPQMVINRVKDLLAARRPGAGVSSGSPAAEVDRQSVVSQGVPPGPGGSLEDYFDRLDAAFASFDGGPGAASPVGAAPAAASPAGASPAGASTSPSGPSPGFGPPAHNAAVTAAAAATSPPGADILSGWDPDLTGDPKKAAAIDPPAIELDPSRGFAPPQAVSSPEVPSTHAAAAPVAPAAPLPSLAEAFAALLSAEQSQPIAPSAIAAAPVSDDMVEAIVRRVIARLGDQAVRETVVDVAERLVRQEIERIRNA